MRIERNTILFCILMILSPSETCYGQPFLKAAYNIGGTDHDYYTHLNIDNQGNLFMSGGFQQTVDFDVKSGVHYLSSPNGQGIYLVKYNANFDLLWAKSFVGTGSWVSSSLSSDSEGNICITGHFNLQSQVILSRGVAHTFLL